MHFITFSLFPEIIEHYFNFSIAAKAVEKGIISYQNINFREYALDRHRTCDDTPYGGGAGMVIKPEPLSRAIEVYKDEDLHVIYASPSGHKFTQLVAKRLAGYKKIALIAGRYEGIDQRIIDLYVDEELCVGDYIMSSGELACMVIIDAVMRLVDGVISKESLEEESFENGLLEYPHYTKPEVFKGLHVPEVLLSGHHKRIKEWREQKRWEKTLANRPEIVQNGDLDL